MATLTYVYADSTAVLGPLATYAEPHCYDLCAEHSERLTAPRGWDVVRLAADAAEQPVVLEDGSLFDMHLDVADGFFFASGYLGDVVRVQAELPKGLCQAHAAIVRTI